MDADSFLQFSSVPHFITFCPIISIIKLGCVIGTNEMYVRSDDDIAIATVLFS